MTCEKTLNNGPLVCTGEHHPTHTYVATGGSERPDTSTGDDRG